MTKNQIKYLYVQCVKRYSGGFLIILNSTVKIRPTIWQQTKFQRPTEHKHGKNCPTSVCHTERNGRSVIGFLLFSVQSMFSFNTIQKQRWFVSDLITIKSVSLFKDKANLIISTTSTVLVPCHYRLSILVAPPFPSLKVTSLVAPPVQWLSIPV